MRRGVENSIADLRQNIINLAQTVNQTHYDLRDVRRDLDSQGAALKDVQDDINRLKTLRAISNNAWSGPKRAAIWITTIGGVLIAATAIWNFLPTLLRLIIDTPVL